MPEIILTNQANQILISQEGALNTYITETIDNIPKEDWDRIFGENKIESYSYQKTLEKSELENFIIKYLLVKRGEYLLAIVPLFIINFSMLELLPKYINKLPMPKIIKNLFSMRMLFIGAPTIEEAHIGISAEGDFNILLSLIINGLTKLSRKEKVVTMLFNNLSGKDKILQNNLMSHGFFSMESLPNSVININFKNMDEYLNTLSSNMRKDLRRKLKKSSLEAKLTTQVREDISDILPEIYQLYLNNLNGGEVQFETLTKEFFKNLSNNMAGIAKFFITYEKEKIIAFNFCLVKGDYCIDKFVGFDQDLAHKYHLYFTTIYHNLNWCIENGIKFYETGTTDYHPKVRLGARLIPLYIYGKAINPILHQIMKRIMKFIQPKNMDPSLKVIEKQGYKTTD